MTRQQVYDSIKSGQKTVKDFSAKFAGSNRNGTCYEIDVAGEPKMVVRLNKDGTTTWVS